MFTRITSKFPSAASIGRGTIIASATKPILYVCYDNILYEMSLVDNRLEVMKDFSEYNDINMICDENGDLYIDASRGSGSTYKGCYYRLRFGHVDWEHLPLGEVPVIRSSLYQGSIHPGRGHIWLNRTCQDNNRDSRGRDIVYQFENADDLGRDLSGTFTLDSNVRSTSTDNKGKHLQWMAPYVDEENQPNVIVCIYDYNRHYTRRSQLFTTKGQTLKLLWQSEFGIYEEFTYSPVTKRIYSLTYPYINPKYDDVYISVFHYDVPSLFDWCIMTIQKYPDLRTQVPPYIKEKIGIPL